MSLSRIQRLTSRGFAAFSSLLARARKWVLDRPRFSAWLYAPDGSTQDSRYRDLNGWIFAQFSEQERMLADRPRMDFYHAAIARHVQPGDRVIDLGTGTGILAAFAARRGAAKVYAIDHSRILSHARTLAAHNRIENVEFVPTHSKDFTVDEPVDAIVHDQMGDWLFDEAMVSNVCDLRDRVLKPGGLILPGRFDLYCEPVKLFDERRVPFIWELDVHGFDYSPLEWSRPQEPGYYHMRGCDPGMIEHFLGEPEPALSIDLHTLREADMPREVRFERVVAHPGRLDGFAVFFCAKVDDDLSMTSDPLHPGRAPHWGFRILRTEREDFGAGDRIEVGLRAERWQDPDSWRWSHARRSTDEWLRSVPVAKA